MQEILQCYVLKTSSTNKATRGFIKQIKGSREGFKRYLGGLEVIPLFDSVVAVVSADANKHGYLKNRILVSQEGKIIDYISGRIIIVARYEDGNFTSIQFHDIAQIERVLKPVWLAEIVDDKVVSVDLSRLDMSAEEFHGEEKYLELLKERELMCYRKWYGEDSC